MAAGAAAGYNSSDANEKELTYPGSSWYKPTQKWRAKHMINGRDYHLGYYTDRARAAEAYRTFTDMTLRGGGATQCTSGANIRGDTSGANNRGDAHKALLARARRVREKMKHRTTQHGEHPRRRPSTGAVVTRLRAGGRGEYAKQAAWLKERTKEVQRARDQLKIILQTSNDVVPFSRLARAKGGAANTAQRAFAKSITELQTRIALVKKNAVIMQMLSHLKDKNKAMYTTTFPWLVELNNALSVAEEELKTVQRWNKRRREGGPELQALLNFRQDVVSTPTPEAAQLLYDIERRIDQLIGGGKRG